MKGSVCAIIPVHNSRAYLSQCLESVFHQTVAAQEVICVDDGSTDGSLEILREFQHRHPELTVLQSDENRGVSASRNLGLAHASSDYVLFIDSDDFIDETLIEKAHDRSLALGSDMTIFGFDEYYASNDAYVPREMFDSPELADRAFSLSELVAPATELVTPNVWRILFRRDFLATSKVLFHEDLATSEDLAFIYETLPLASKIGVLNERLYHYRRDGGVTLTRQNRGLAGFKALDYAFSLARDNGTLMPCQRHFVNITLDVAEYAMSSAATSEEFFSLHARFVSQWLGPVIEGSALIAPRYERFLAAMQSQDAASYLFDLYSSQRSTTEALRSEAFAQGKRIALLEQSEQAARSEVEDVRNSWSYRVGNALVAPPSLIKRLLKKARH